MWSGQSKHFAIFSSTIESNYKTNSALNESVATGQTKCDERALLYADVATLPCLCVCVCMCVCGAHMTGLLSGVGDVDWIRLESFSFGSLEYYNYITSGYLNESLIKYIIGN